MDLLLLTTLQVHISSHLVLKLSREELKMLFTQCSRKRLDRKQ